MIPRYMLLPSAGQTIQLFCIGEAELSDLLRIRNAPARAGTCLSLFRFSNPLVRYVLTLSDTAESIFPKQRPSHRHPSLAPSYCQDCIPSFQRRFGKSSLPDSVHKPCRPD